MGIDAIKEKIVNDATEYANKLISEANQEAEVLLAQAKKEEAVILEQMAEREYKGKTAVRHRMEAASELEGRKMRLAVKQSAAQTVAEATVERLANMEQSEYVAFLAKKIAETGIIEGQILLNERDKEAVGSKVVVAANELLKDGKLTLAKEVINAKGGFILRRGSVEINSSLETMVQAVRSKVDAEVMVALFQRARYEKI